jgi:hypothetical protein
METCTILIRYFINNIGQKLPRDAAMAVAASPPKAAATFVRRCGSYGPIPAASRCSN